MASVAAACLFPRTTPAMAQQFPARFKLSGQVLNVFERPKGKTRDGVEYGGDTVVQLLSTDTLRNGEQRVIQSEVSCGEDRGVAQQWRDLVGKIVSVPCSVYVSNGDLRVQLADQSSVPKLPTAKPAAAATGTEAA